MLKQHGQNFKNKKIRVILNFLHPMINNNKKRFMCFFNVSFGPCYFFLNNLKLYFVISTFNLIF